MQVGTIAIRTDIGDGGVSDQMFANKLDELGDVDEVRLLLNSYGGSVFSAVSMVAQMNRHPARFVVEVEGVAASAASFLAVSADELLVHENGFMMVHRASGGVIGTAVDLRAQAGVLDQLDQMFASMYSRRTGGSVRDWLSAMDCETWLAAPELSDMGLAKVIGGKATANPYAAKARAGIANRSVRAADLINRLSRPAARVTDARTRESLAKYQAVVDQIERDVLLDARRDARRTILTKADNKAQAARYLAWS